MTSSALLPPTPHTPYYPLNRSLHLLPTPPPYPPPQGHAREYLKTLPRSELLQYDGVVGVGGDGLFQELMNGLLESHKDVTCRPPEAGPRLRLAQIPAGSTDVVACSANGTRSAAAAALHVVLGDRMPMDVMRLESLDRGFARYAVTMASYGFLGDTMRKSEAMRWIGPVR